MDYKPTAYSVSILNLLLHMCLHNLSDQTSCSKPEVKMPTVVQRLKGEGDIFLRDSEISIARVDCGAEEWSAFP